jgi:hypothetical protein
MRAFFLGLVVLLVFLPAILILFAPRQPLTPRLLWGLLAFLSPVLAFGLTQLMPSLTNNLPGATQWGRLAGLLIAGAGLILPWVMFALFLHRNRPR